MELITFEQFIKYTANKLQITPSEISKITEQKLKQFRLKPRDLITYINYTFLHLTQVKLAKKMGVSQPLISYRVAKIRKIIPKECKGILVPDLFHMKKFNPSRDQKNIRIKF